MQTFGPPAAPAAGPLGCVPGLVLLYADDWRKLPATWPFARDRLLIGRQSDCDIVLDVPAVSRLHAEVAFRSGGWSVRDLDSRNGVFVDGRRIREAPLLHQSQLRIGDSILQFVEAHADAMGAYRLDGSQQQGALSAQYTSPVCLVGGWQIERLRLELQRLGPTNLSVLLAGESGSGKELAAQELHAASGRRGPLCAINCAALPANLIESELFGFKRGAFSGAERDKQGLIQSAQGGTLLLDEVGDMPLEAQAKLLRVLQSRQVVPLGSTTPELIDVRIVSATHRNLIESQRQGRFRADLFARLAEATVELPPLRDRKEDLFLLLQSLTARHGLAHAAPTFALMTALLHYDWPYNVRELESFAKRTAALSASSQLDESLATDPMREAMQDYGRALTEVTPSEADPTSTVPPEDQLRSLLALHRGNVAAVGRDLGKARMQVHRWMKRYGITPDDYR
jgi:transcriptional regulator with PAS, ATPase and Fis domain